ncbi:sensor histidine kinase [Pectobacterium zantedeschiae]|uniref:sensor histidine kinase n=1 Tax=Pectobacterium zantedeschiae TaxID=2034769 RepID=UPI00101BEF3D|nr:sensor histidine kinase [Pectobacterium zantedeschiae]RYC43096.1 ATP-binding protein [Pectobacterium zantedeschiae]
MENNILYFKISSGLKRVIGRDLITNDFVAVFELVKNSFDARATNVDVLIRDDRIFIVDDGKGMTYVDIMNKWLFVAYSAKKDGTEDINSDDYRNKLYEHRSYAGSKGVGRFSCDRLGHALRLQTRSKNSSNVENLVINWDNFELDNKNEFVDIKIEHYESDSFIIPEGCRDIEHGTILEIINPRENWDREKLLLLKSALSKLINPFSTTTESFGIYLHAPQEYQKDESIEEDVKNIDNENFMDSFQYNKIVNGRIENFIFEALEKKTTRLNVYIDGGNGKIISELVDRGEVIYKISEENHYHLINNSDFQCNLYYLNQSAKATFTRRMGVRPVEFGSIFLFRNGFRVFPIGEEGLDTFGIDRRKQQGYARYLGTRDIIGRIDVNGRDDDFRESTSRDQGLIETPAYIELTDILWSKCIKRLENYVVGVNWADKLDANVEDISRLTGDKARARIIEIVSKIANGSNVELLYFSKDLVSIINEKSEDFERSLQGLRLVADKANNSELLNQIEKAEIRYNELKQAEQFAQLRAEKEQKARLEAEARAFIAEKEREKVQDQLKLSEKEKLKIEQAYSEEKKRNLFLASMTSVDYDTIVNLHHQIGIYSANIHNLLANQLDKIKHNEKIEPEYLINLLEQLTFKNQQILSLSRFATKANFRLNSEKIKVDLVDFIKDYINQVCVYYSGDGLDIEVNSSAKGLVKEFKPIEISMLIDNLVNNAEKAGATKVLFDISQANNKQVEIKITDDGRGLDDKVIEPERIFEKGFSTTSGSGLGLYHVAFILDQMDGSISVNDKNIDGTQFIIRVAV